jgi:hypothetical protein
VVTHESGDPGVLDVHLHLSAFQSDHHSVVPRRSRVVGAVMPVHKQAIHFHRFEFDEDREEFFCDESFVVFQVGFSVKYTDLGRHLVYKNEQGFTTMQERRMDEKYTGARFLEAKSDFRSDSPTGNPTTGGRWVFACPVLISHATSARFGAGTPVIPG